MHFFLSPQGWRQKGTLWLLPLVTVPQKPSLALRGIFVNHKDGDAPAGVDDDGDDAHDENGDDGNLVQSLWWQQACPSPPSLESSSLFKQLVVMSVIVTMPSICWDNSNKTHNDEETHGAQTNVIQMLQLLKLKHLNLEINHLHQQRPTWKNINDHVPNLNSKDRRLSGPREWSYVIVHFVLDDAASLCARDTENYLNEDNSDSLANLIGVYFNIYFVQSNSPTLIPQEINSTKIRFILCNRGAPFGTRLLEQVTAPPRTGRGVGPGWQGTSKDFCQLFNLNWQRWRNWWWKEPSGSHNKEPT